MAHWLLEAQPYLLAVTLEHQSDQLLAVTLALAYLQAPL
jgi:hypothetical protein